MDRRQFLRDSSRIVAAAAGWTAANAAIRGLPAASPATTSASEKVVLGMIGVGGRGGGLMSWALDHPRAVVGSVCDVSEERLAGAAKAVLERSVSRESRAPARERDFRRVLDDTSIDAVISRRGYFQTYLGAKEEQGPGLKGGAGNAEHVHNFVDCVAGSAQPNADAETAHLSCALVHLGEIAYRTGRALRFDPKTETFPGDAEANELLTKAYRRPWGFEGADLGASR